MLTFPSALRIFLAVEPVDMRQQFNGLWAAAEQKLQENPRLGGIRPAGGRFVCGVSTARWKWFDITHHAWTRRPVLPQAPSIESKMAVRVFAPRKMAAR